jgi:maltose alpha-D-glucosyltransferase/alpha-amylase
VPSPRARCSTHCSAAFTPKKQLIGQRTGEMHLALAAESDDKAFRAEPFNAMAQRSVYQSMRASLRRAFALLQKEAARSAKPSAPRPRRF